jgi:hypothetical protein
MENAGMKGDYRVYSDVRFLLAKCRSILGRPEKRKYHSREDIRTAERRFLEFALEQRRHELEEELYQRQSIS